jgi:hypothetical protein
MKMAPSRKKHIRKEKARIRREVLELEKRKKMIRELYIKFSKKQIEDKKQIQN